MDIFYIEMTDTFGGDLNFCWVKRFKVKSSTIRGAISKVSKETGFNFRNNGLHYKALGACVAAYEADFDWLTDEEIEERYGDRLINL